MTTQHTIESPAEYTPEEQIAALKNLGMEESEINIVCRQCDGTGRFPDGSECGYCEVGYSIKRYSGWIWSNETPAIYEEFESIEAAHEFLRTDPNTWMAMASEIVEGESAIWRLEFNNSTGYQFVVYSEYGMALLSSVSSTPQKAVYDCYMQFIRMELKK